MNTQPGAASRGTGERQKPQENKSARQWRSNNWLIAIAGGALATVLGTYAVAAVSHLTPAPHTPALPARVSTPVQLQIDPEQISAAHGPAMIYVFITGLTPDGPIAADLYLPDGGGYVSEGATADSQGDFTFSTKWPAPFTGSSPLGDYRVVVRDQTTGATATGIVDVTR